MPIFFSKEKQEWILKDMEQEEVDFLLELGKQQFLKNISMLWFQRMLPQLRGNGNDEELDALAQMDPDEMGKA